VNFRILAAGYKLLRVIIRLIRWRIAETKKSRFWSLLFSSELNSFVFIKVIFVNLVKKIKFTSFF
jgi:hypothetical protein